MSFSHIISQAVSVGGDAITKAQTLTSTSRISVSESIATAQTDFNITVAIDVSAVKSFYMVSDKAVTVETNDGSAPDDTIVLVADIPYIWTTNSYDTFLLTADVTSLKITNASGSTATLKIEAIIDASP